MFTQLFIQCADQRKRQNSAALIFVRGIPHKGPVARKIFLFDDVIMCYRHIFLCILFCTLFRKGRSADAKAMPLYGEGVQIALPVFHKSKLSIRQSPLRDFMGQFHCVC